MDLGKVRRIPHYANNAAHTLLSNGLGWAYGLSNPLARRVVQQPFYQLSRVQTLLAEGRQGHIYIAQGLSAVDGQPLCVAYVGSWPVGQRNTLLFFQHLMFQEEALKVEDLGTFTGGGMRERAEALAGQVDLVAVNCHNLLAWQPDHGDWMRGPVGLRMTFDFSPYPTWDDVEERLRLHQSRSVRKVRNSGLSFRISRKDEAFADFYHQMHVPMVKLRYHDYGDILNEPGLYKVFKQNGLIFQIVDADEQVLGGAFYYLQNRVAYGLLNGVRDGDPELIKRGVLLCIYYFSIKWAFEQGMRCVDAGLCPSYASSGLLQHKQSWGFQPLLDLWKPYSLLFWSPRSMPSALAWMKQYPFVPEVSQRGGPNMA